MLVAYTYKLSPSKSQALELGQHVEMLRLQYNYRLREREEAYRQAAFPVMGDYSDIYTKAECCPLTCSVSKNALYGETFSTDKKTGKVKRRGALAQQDADLPNLKKSRPWYGRIQHHVLQQMLRRVDDAFQRFFKGLADYPKPKRRSKYHSFSYPPKVKVVAAKSGVLFHEINPCHTSQECSMCGFISPKNRDGEKFLCESCGYIADADIDAAITIRQRGLTELGISIPLPGVTRKVTPKNSAKVSPGREHQQQYVESGNHQQVEFKTLKGTQLSLFDWMGVI
ncbi:MAG TPA: zinc ribbon domain-containing protein [Candidatus Obscuribacterales bacterium]